MNIKTLFFAWTLFLIIGILLKILHVTPFISDFLIGSSFLIMIFFVYFVYKKIVAK
jgi:hypothetical protein